VCVCVCVCVCGGWIGRSAVNGHNSLNKNGHFVVLVANIMNSLAPLGRADEWVREKYEKVITGHLTVCENENDGDGGSIKSSRLFEHKNHARKIFFSSCCSSELFSLALSTANCRPKGETFFSAL
jgi:hypothetical protein